MILYKIFVFHLDQTGYDQEGEVCYTKTQAGYFSGQWTVSGHAPLRLDVSTYPLRCPSRSCSRPDLSPSHREQTAIVHGTPGSVSVVRTPPAVR